jgi:hypothetical protein
LLYSSVYIFRSERSALRPPKKWHFWPPHWSKSTGVFVGNGIFYRAPFWGRFWGSKSGELLQKSVKFQKIPFLGSGVPEVDFRQFWPPHGKSIFEHFWVVFWSFYKRSFLGRFLTIFHPPFSSSIKRNF